MRKAFATSLWFICFIYSILLLFYGNSGIIAYNKALQTYENIDKNIQTLSLYVLENESKFDFWKTTLAGNLVHELGYINNDEVMVFPVISTIPSVKQIKVEQFSKTTTANTRFILKAVISGLVVFALVLLGTLLKRKKC